MLDPFRNRWRLPAAVLVSTGCVAGATLAITDVARTAFSNEPSAVWVANDAAGSVSHLTPGGVDATIGLDAPQGDLRVVQTGDGGAYVIDESGRVSRVDPATIDVTEDVTLPSSDTQLVTGGGRLYAVDGAAGTARQLDPDRLTALSRDVEVGDDLGFAVVDDTGVLWVPDLATGAVVAVDGDVVQSRVAVADPDSEVHLVLVGPAVVAIDPDGVDVIGVAGASDEPVTVPLTPGDDVAAPRDVATGDIVPVLGDGDQLALVDVRAGDVSTVDLAVDDHDLGVPEVAADKVWIPDYTSGSLLVVELPAGTLAEPVVVSGEAGEFELVVTGDHVYVNDPDSEEAWSIDADGNVIPAEKYDPDDPGTGTPPPSVPPAPELPDAPDATAPPAPVEPTPDDPGDAPIPEPEVPTITLPPTPITVPPPADGGGGGGGGPPGNDPPDTTDPGTGTTTTTEPTPDTEPTGDGAVTDVLASPGDRAVTVTWSAPTAWYAVTGYRLRVSPGGATAEVGAGAQRHEFADLTNGTGYQVTVTAVSDQTTGPGIISNVATPVAGIPDAPTSINADVGPASVRISWSAPTSRVDGYRVEVAPTAGGASLTQDVGAGAASATFDGLSNGTTYGATVRAINDGAVSAPADSGKFVPTDIPGAPIDLRATATSATEVEVTWGAAPDNGAAVTTYTVTSSGGGGKVDVGGTATRATVSGLTTGQTYTFEVVATNAVGSGPPAGSNAVLMETLVPGTPGNVSAVAFDGRADVSWTIPPGNGTTIDHFEIVGGPTTVMAGGGAQSTTVGGLANGTTYSFQVIAVGANGANSPPGGPSPGVTPSGPPASPTGVTAAAVSRGRIDVSWSQVSPSNGTSVAQWRVTASGGGGTQTVGTPAATFGGLADETAYTFTVVAIGANTLESGASAPGGATTSPGPPSQSPNVGVTGDIYDRGSGEIVWNAVPGADSYLVEGGEGGSATVTGTSHGTGILYCGSYTFTVTPMNAVGPGPSGSVTISVGPEPGFQCV